MDYVNSLNTFTSSYADDDESANVILVDRFSNSIGDSGFDRKLDNISSSVLLLFSPETEPNVTSSPDLFNETVKNSVGYRDPLSIILPISICYFIIFVTGILGNVITCVVIAKNKTMHTATNYYLFNLAVSDFLVLIFGELSDFLFSNSNQWFRSFKVNFKALKRIQKIRSRFLSFQTNAEALSQSPLKLCFSFVDTKWSRKIKFIKIE